MPAPSQRRSSVRRTGSSVRSPVVAPSRQQSGPQKAVTEELDVQSATEGVEADAGTSVSGRTSSVRTSRRTKSISARSSNRTTVRRELSPEEQGQRRAATKSLLLTLFGVALLIIVIAVLVLVVFKKDPQRDEAAGRLAQIQTDLPTIDTRVEYEDAKKRLAAVADIPELAARKAELGKALAEREAQVVAGEREARVTDNRRSLVARLGKLADPETDLKQLAIDAQAFTRNPVDPQDQPNPEFAQTYAAAVSDIQVRLASIESERRRREAAATTGVAQRVQLEVEALVKDEKFKEALSLIIDNAAKYPDADLSRVRTFVTDSAASAWTSVAGYVENRYADYTSTGITKSSRDKALADAQARLDGVIANWGIDTYISQAKELRAKH